MKKKSILTLGIVLVLTIVSGLLALRDFGLHPQQPNTDQPPGAEGHLPPFDGRYRPGLDGVGYPTCAFCPNPKYPKAARRAKSEGFVVLSAVVTPDGRAIEIRVVKADRSLGLEKMAVEAVRRWRFNPALGPNGTPVAVEVPIEVVFRLGESPHKGVGVATGQGSRMPIVLQF